MKKKISNNKIANVLKTLPVCIPFGYVFYCCDYYGDFTPIILLVPVIMAVAIGVIYGAKDKLSQLLAGGAISTVLSVIITELTNNGIDEGYFCPIGSVFYAAIMSIIFFLIADGFAAVSRAISRKIIKKKTIEA